MSKDFSFYLSLIEKPVNLLFSIDQFLFEFSKRTYQQKKTGEFFQQLKERKKFSLFYGHLTRKQILNLFNKMKKNKGYFSKNIFSLLERRLDVVLYRSGLLKTIAEARQLIKHKKILVNQKVIDVPSFLLYSGDFVSIQQKMGGILSNQLANSLKTKRVKNHPKIVRDFYSTLKKILDFSQSLTKSQKLLSTTSPIIKFRSKHLCKLVIQLLCTRIKLRSYWNLNKDKCYPTHVNLEKFKENSLSVQKKQFLIMFKWKSLSQKKHFFSKNLGEKLMNKPFRRKNNQEQVIYANGGCLQKKPVFSNRTLLNLKKKQLFTKTFLSNSKKSQSITQQMSHYASDKKDFKLINFKKKNIALYRKSFLLFLKHLENSKKFTSIISLSMKKSLLKNSFYKQKSINKEFYDFSRNLNFRLIRPLNFEVSYNLLNIIYLYSPQRVNFPFYIDLDLIKRSLR
nr:30S ribosomal protein S4 [Micractinium variabile]QTK15919.1 30S ribosomal protein S4 [Micractinium variabile]